MVPVTDTAQVVPPPGRGGWWHRYVCPAHGVELEPVGLTAGAFPNGGAPCRYGCRIDTEDVRGAWTVLAHQACARRLVELAGAPESRPVAARLLDEYAVRYAEIPPEHDGSPGWMVRGRLFQQALTEAIWAVRIADAARALPDRTPAVAALLGSLAAGAQRARAELVEQGRFTANYTAWLNAAGAACTGDPGWLDGPHGTFAHVLAATGEDGWEWEASTYYHTFVLRAYLLALRDTADANVPAPVLARLRLMVDALGTVRTAGGDLPALHDGPYAGSGSDAEYAELWRLVAERGWPQPAPAGDGVTVHRQAGYAVLRGDGIQAIVDFGPHGGSHGHRDKLALYLYGPHTPWQPDPGQVPYGHPEWRAHYAGTAAHPTFQVDGVEQAECSGTLLAVDETGVTVGVDGAYPGVRATRRIELAGDMVVDTVTVRTDTPSRISLLLRPDVPLEVWSDGAVTHTVWSGQEELHGGHTCDSPHATFTCRPGPGPADDPQRVRTHVDWTVRDATEVTFTSVYRTGEP